MRKYLRFKKAVTFFTTLVFLFGGAGVLWAQTESFPTLYSSEVDGESGTNIIDADTTFRKELDTIEESIGKTEDVLDTIDRVTETKSENTESDNTVDETGNAFQTQSQELLRILQEKDVTRIEGVKREKIKNTRIFLENNAMEDGVVEEEDLKSNALLDDNIDTGDLEGGLEDITDLEEVEALTAEEVQKLEEIVLEKKTKIIERVKVKKARMEALKDSDGDGISDYDEVNIYGTDPFSEDSDGDGYFDGAEVLRGFDPKDSSLDAIVVYENPKESGKVEESLFAVGKIEVIKEPASSNEKDASETATSFGKVLFEGKSLPNSFITLYIFSIPTVVTVKTDKDGNWSYVMDNELENGEHEIYVAMTDNSGKILAKSNPMPFVKEALAVTVDENLLSFQVEGSNPSFFNVGYLYVTILTLVFLVGIVLTVIGIRLNFRKEEVEDIV